MTSATRRDFIKRTLLSAPSCALAAKLAGLTLGRSHPANAQLPAHGSLPRFVDPLPILSRLVALSHDKVMTHHRIRMMECTHRLHSSLPPTRLWGYEGLYPGPIVEAVRGQPIEMEWVNNLPTKHLFAIDPHIHGAMPPAPTVRTVPHLHGSRTNSLSDGLPEKWFTPGNSVRYTYPNDQMAATLWYHDHAVGITRLNVYAGLSGFYLLRDDAERKLGLPEGEYEIPILLQDRTVNDAGQLVYNPTHDDGLPLAPGVWGPEFFGSVPVLNGAIYPYLEVEPRLYRLRFLNGSNSRFFNVYLNLASSATEVPSYVPFQQIGSDGGLLSKPVTLKRFLMGPAERADLLVDFSGLEGKTLTLSNDASSPFPGWGSMSTHAAPILDLMQFRVNRPRKPSATTYGKTAFLPVERFRESDVVTERTLVLVEQMDEQGRSLGVRINNKGYDDPVTEIVKLGTMEKWTFINTTEDAHPMHLHLVQFQVLHRQGFDPIEFRKGNLKPVGDLRPPAEQEAGWKDTAIVLPSEMLTILARFEGYTGRYVFHCHMLEHEDNDMMRPFEVRS